MNQAEGNGNKYEFLRINLSHIL